MSELRSDDIDFTYNFLNRLPHPMINHKMISPDLAQIHSPLLVSGGIIDHSMLTYCNGRISTMHSLQIVSACGVL